jgi:hypothetical protein
MTGWYDTWDDSSSAVPGYVTITTNTGSTTSVFRVTGSVTAATGYYKIPVAWVSGTNPSGSITTVLLSFSRTGDNGATTTINAQTASYTLVIGDAGKQVEMNVATANTLTVPLNSSVAFAVGAQITILQTGAGTTTISPTSGVTINYYSPSAASTRTLKGQWGAATLVKRATDTWVLIGNLT